MNEVGPPRPPLSRAAPILAIGVALVLAGGFAMGIFVGRKPLPAASPAADQVLPPAIQPPASVAVPPPVPQPAPPPVVSPPSPAPPPPVVAPPIPRESSPPAKPAAVAAPERKPAPAEPAASPKPRVEPRPVSKAKPVTRQKPAVAATHPAAKHAAPPPAGDGRWAIRLGAFQSDDHAKLLVDTLKFHGHPAQIAKGHDRSGRAWFFVRTPSYETRAEAEAVAKRLRDKEHVPAIVFEMRAVPRD
jgi:DedD protein